MTTSIPEATANIEKFIHDIPTENDPSKVLELQEGLIDSLEKSSSTLSCLQDKVSTFTQVESKCRAGENNLQALYSETVELFETDTSCTGSVS